MSLTPSGFIEMLTRVAHLGRSSQVKSSQVILFLFSIVLLFLLSGICDIYDVLEVSISREK